MGEKKVLGKWREQIIMEHIGNESSKNCWGRKEPMRREERNKKQEVKKGDVLEQTIITCE